MGLTVEILDFERRVVRILPLNTPEFLAQKEL